jgi:predicted enzyme related to lactoylglutathione lyase
VHFEIPFENKDRAMKFYTQCFGWQLQDMTDELRHGEHHRHGPELPPDGSERDQRQPVRAAEGSAGTGAVCGRRVG